MSGNEVRATEVGKVLREFRKNYNNIDTKLYVRYVLPLVILVYTYGVIGCTIEVMKTGGLQAVSFIEWVAYVIIAKCLAKAVLTGLVTVKKSIGR